LATIVLKNVKKQACHLLFLEKRTSSVRDGRDKECADFLRSVFHFSTSEGPQDMPPALKRIILNDLFTALKGRSSTDSSRGSAKKIDEQRSGATKDNLQPAVHRFGKGVGPNFYSLGSKIQIMSAKSYVPLVHQHGETAWPSRFNLSKNGGTYGFEIVVS
jgi:hypothetical protein